MHPSPAVKASLTSHAIGALVGGAAALCILPFVLDGLSLAALLGCAFGATMCIIAAWITQEKYRHGTEFSYEFTSR